jgi:hypothetical protein
MIATKADESMSMTGLNLFGLFAVAVMVTAYALEARHSAFVLVFAASCVLASIYGFLQGAWPFGMVEAVWSVVAARRWLMIVRSGSASVRRVAARTGN